MIGLLPAAGLGRRMGGGAKELALLDERTGIRLCDVALGALRQAKVDRVVVVVSPRKQAVRDALGDGADHGLELCYVVQDPPHGLPHAVACAAGALGEQPVLLVMPDTVFAPLDAPAVVARRQAASRADVVLGVFPTDEPTRLAPVELDGDGRVVAMFDKPTTTHLACTWGVVAWSPRFTARCATMRPPAAGGEVSLTEVFDDARRAGWSVAAERFAAGWFCDAGTPAGLVRAQAAWAGLTGGR